MKKILSLLVVFGLLLGLVPAAALASAKTSENAASRPSFRAERAASDDYVPPAEGCARITLTVGDVWGDGSGYQMLLDADATAYGSVFPATGALSSSGDVPEATYAEFEYKIPENADGALTTENIVINNSITIEIPAGTYDWCITNPTPDDRMWIASDQGNVGGRADDYEFEEGYSYAFEVSLMGSNDGTDVTITDPTGYTPEPPTPVLGFYFEDEAEVAEFTIINNDTSTYTWERYNSNAYEGSYCMRVHWQVTPSDWLITPAVEVPAVDPSVTFYAKAHSGTYAETVNVYVGTAPEIDAMTQLGDEVTLTTAYMQYEYDLADYAGETIYFAIEYTGDDAYYAYVDQIEFWGEDAEEPPAEQIIYEVDITDFTVPAWNEHPDFDVEVPEDAHCTVDYTAWTVVIDGNNETMISSDMFDSEEYSYFMSIRLVPDEGYEFEDLPEVTINGDSSLVNYAHTNVDGELLVYSSEFTVSAPIVSAPPVDEVIDTIEIINFAEPAWNEAPFYNVTVPDDANYSVDFIDWYWWDEANEEGNVMAPDQLFNNEAYVYYMDISVVPDEGYTFDEGTVLLLNGSASNVEFGYFDDEEGAYWAYTVDFTVEDPGTEPPAGDLDAALNIEGGTIHFETGETYPWVTVQDGDRYYAKSSNEGVSSSTSTLTAVVNVTAGDELIFEYNANGEGTGGEVGISSVWDACSFSVDGTVVLKVGSAQAGAWNTFTYTFEEGGEHELVWSYSKDSSVNPTGDYFAVDNVGIAAGLVPPVTEPPVAEPIDTIEINDLTLPAWGENPDYDVTVPADAHYSVDYMDWNWWDINADEGEILAPSQAFDNENYVYYAYWQIIPDEGYEFADEVTVLVDGDASVIETKGWSANSGYYWAYTIDFTVENDQPPVTEPPEMSDLDRALNVEGGTIHFETGETYPWVTVQDGDRYYAKSSNEGVSSSTSTLTTTVTAAAGSLLVFDYNANGEGTGGEVGISSVWDACSFSVDGTVVLKVGSVYAGQWRTFSYVFETDGEHELTWSYSKDSSVNPTGDYFAVDNVYVGEPVLPEAINVFDVTVKANRNTYVVYTMEPDDVTETEVTFEIADTSIATVDENGMIHGVAVGETTVTVTSVADPTVSGTATVTVTEPDPEVQLYGYATYDIGGTFSESWITFTDREPGDVTALGTADDAYAAAYYDGFVYGYRQEDGAFFKMNAETYEVEYFEDATISATPLDMAYNYANQTMYLLAQDNDTYNILLFTVDLETGAVSECGQLSIPSGGILALTYDGEGNLYGLGYSPTSAGFYGIDVETLECTLIGETGVPMNYVQSMHYDMNTGRLFWAQIFSTSSNGLYEIDPETGAAELLGTIGESGMEITGLYTIYDEGGEPEPIDLIEINDFVVPEWGANPFYGVTIPEDAHYSKIQGLWYRYNASGPMNPDDTFNDPDEQYYMYFFFVPMEGYEFADEVTVLINGSAALVFFSTAENGGISVYTNYFTVEEEGDPYAIHEVWVDGWGTPIEGVAGIDHVFLTTPEDAPYYIVYAGWLDEDEGQQLWNDEHVFIAGHYYSEGCQIWAEEGYYFAEDCVFLTHDGDDILDVGWCYVDEEENWICYMNSIPTMCEGSAPALLGDVDLDGEVTTADALLAMRYAMGLVELTDEQLAQMDVNGDGVYDLVDATLILRYAMGIIDEFPSEPPVLD